jgi:WD40 repeat protein
MSTSKQIFSFSQKVNGSRPPVTCWSHDSSYLAVGTERKYVYIVDKRGKVLVEKELPNSGRVEIIDWDNEDEMLAILQEGASSVLLWAPFTGNLLDELQF